MANSEAYNALVVEVQGLRVLLQGERLENETQAQVNGELRGLARDYKLAFKHVEQLLAAKTLELEAAHAALEAAEARVKALERRQRRQSSK